MPSSDFYWSRSLIRGFGKMWFPLSLQEATSTGGGESLLGSIVEELHSGFLGFSHYPAPYHMTTPAFILNILEQRRQDLDLPETLTLDTELAAPMQTLKINKKGSLKAGVGPFPSLPAVCNLDVDYSRMVSVSIAFGASTRVKYIPTGYLTQLYQAVEGDAARIHPTLAIRVDSNYIVDQILLANEFSITFESESDFDAEFGAKLEFLNATSSPSGKVAFSRETDRCIVVKIHNGPDYLLAFKVIDWDDLG